MSEEEKPPSPRWDIIVQFYDDLDAVLEKYVNEKECNFLEIETALLMLKEKIQETKLNLLVDVKSKQGNTTKETPDDMYK